MISFFAYGHPNIKADHRNTIEFTKENSVTPAGNCIAGVSANFNTKEIQEYIKAKDLITITIKLKQHSFKIQAIPNKEFSDKEEIVLRRSEFSSKRTLGLRADKVCIDLPNSIRRLLSNPETKIKIEIK